MGVLEACSSWSCSARCWRLTPATVTGFAVAGWVLWSVFVGEFVLRAVVARDRGRFWARNWWQLVFLVVPFLRFARALALLRFARVGSVLPRC